MRIVNISSGFVNANSYLLIDESTLDAAIVDPGGDAPALISAICQNGVKVVAILLTHGHFDHILALDEIKDFTKAPVYIHEYDNVCLGNTIFSLMSMAGRSDTFDDADVKLQDGDEIKIGNSTIKVIHTPGHTTGSVCYMTDAGLISGDTLFYDSIGRTDFPGGDYNTISSSIRSLYKLNGDTVVYPGHGGTTTIERERKFNMFVREN
jgi:glyoxylase-like metal-dependent hydrolase (beta-lactamase superfamily II)